MSTSLTMNEIRARCAAFADRWHDATDEDADAKSFWDELFTCYGANRRQVARFEAPVRMLSGTIGFIDVLWKAKLLVEHKSRGKDLVAAKSQGLDYIERLKPHERPRYLVTSDFARFVVYDLHAGGEISFLLHELAAKVEALAFLAGYEPKRPVEEAPVNIEAVERLGSLYDAMKAGGYPDHDLQLFLVRIMFCLFAEDTGVFAKEAFTDFLTYRTSENGGDLGPRLAQFFQVLDTPKDKRQKNLDELLAGLDYVNGSLFAGQLAFAEMNTVMREALLACTEFDWSRISPAIFGSLFQGVMDGKERRAAGAHYTSEGNILKVINPLFLDALRAELAAILTGPERGREAKLHAFHDKLASLQFLDPACGCGNFLIITYRELRKLEIEVLKALHPHGQMVTDIEFLTKVRVSQFHGIEIGEFPAQIAKVAMWLMDHIENVELGFAFGQSFTRLPLVQSANIVQGNALRIDWKDVLPPEKCSYVFGNPPFVGHHYQSDEQKNDQRRVMKNISASGVIDFVANWHILAAEYTQNTDAKIAFVSTNSLCQGEQASLLWSELFGRYRIKIHFAHRTFAWESEARGKAHVHCVVVGFGCRDTVNKMIFDYEHDEQHPVIQKVTNISPYLVEGPDLAISNRAIPISNVPKMSWGNKPTDGGHFILSPEEKTAMLAAEPGAAKYIRPYMSGGDFINGIERHCLWLKDASPSDLRGLPMVAARVSAVRETRLASKAESTRKFAAYPTLFRQISQPNSDYLAVPEVSSERRAYIPIAFVTKDVICSNKIQFVPNATLWHFGTLTSTMHMSWMRVVCGRLESRYSYSNTIVYNNFPWPAPTETQKSTVEACAQGVLDAREKYPECTLADLYDPLTMPPELAKAHTGLDRAVEKCYRPEPFQSDRERVEFLFALYEKLAAPLAPVVKASKSSASR